MSGSNPRAAWTAIEAAVAGIERAAATYAGYLIQSSSKMMDGADDAIHHDSVRVWRDVCAFRDRFAAVLPVGVVEAIDRFETRSGEDLDGTVAGLDFTRKRVIQIELIALSAEVTYLLHDLAEEIRSTTEIAFMHLQRLIVVDRDYRDRWIEAFKDGETHCEKLGAVHLLWHGILAFKSDGRGGRTDLIFPAPLRDRELASSRGLVLTEWKKAHGKGEPEFRTAKRQTEIYASGVLGAVELTSHRYLVVVTTKEIPVPDDIVEGEVTYRHVNIVVDPDYASVAASKV